MSTTITCTFLSGTIKKIQARKWKSILGASALWDDQNASVISSNYSLDIEYQDLLLFKGSQIFEINYDLQEGKNGYGFTVPAGFKEIKVTDIENTVKVLRFDKQYLNDTIESAYTNTNSVSLAINDILYPGDYVSFSDEATLKVEFNLETRAEYLITGFNLLRLTNLI